MGSKADAFKYVSQRSGPKKALARPAGKPSRRPARDAANRMKPSHPHPAKAALDLRRTIPSRARVT